MRALMTWLMCASVAGCATISPERGHNEVARVVQERAGQATGWAAGPPREDDITRRVRELLRAGLTRERAVQIALINNPQLQATYEELGVAQAEMVQAGLISNPRISGAIGFPISGGSIVEKEFSIVQSFLDLFLLPLRNKVAAEQFDAEVSRVAHEALQTAADTSQAYVEVQAAITRVEMQRVLSEVAGAAAELSERQYDAGNISTLDRANEQATAAQARLELLREERQLFSARERLNRLLGLFGPQTRWTLPSTLPDLPASEPPLENLESRAIAQRLDLRALRGSVALFTRGASLARVSRATGVIEVGMDVHQDADGPVVVGPSLSLELPIFDRRGATIARVDAQLRQAKRRLRGAAIDARSEVRLAFAELQTRREEVRYFRDVLLPVREQVVAETQLMYNAMQIGLFQLLDAKSEHNRALRDYVDAVAAYWAGRTELERALGGSLEPTTLANTNAH